jgi:hypothetical protein
MTTSLDYLKQTGTVVVSDSGDFACEYLISETSNRTTQHQNTAIDVYKPQA